MTTGDPAESRVLLIGFPGFADFARIPAVPNNLRRLKALFGDERFWGVPDRNITVLTGIRGLSRNALLSRIYEVAAQATDTLVVYYVGHGFLDEDDNDNLLLALPGTRKREHFSALPYEEVRRAVRHAGARRKVVILDCCYSGRAHSGGSSGSGGFLSATEEAREFAHQAPIEGACVLTATSDYAKARALPGERYTAFSGTLISVLENGIPDAGPHLDVRSLYGSLRQEMRSRGLPQPHLSTRDDGSELVLGRNLAYGAGTRTTPTPRPRPPETPPPPPVARPRPRRPRLPKGRVLAGILVALATIAAVSVTEFLNRTAQSSSAAPCPTGTPTGTPTETGTPGNGRPGKDTGFPESRFRLLRDLSGPTTLTAYEPPRSAGTPPVTYLWQPDRQCFAAPTGFGRDHLGTAVSPDGKWIAVVEMGMVPDADVIVMDRSGGKRRVIDVPANSFAAHPQWDRTSRKLLFTRASVTATNEYTYPGGADAVIASLPEMTSRVLPLRATAPYQWGPDHTVAGNFGQQDPLDVRFFDTDGEKKWTVERAGLLGQYGMKSFSPSEQEMVTHCPKGQGSNRACVWDSRRGELLGSYPTGRLFTDRPFGSVGWYDEKHLLMTVWDTETDWWSAAALDIVDPEPSTVGGRTTILGRMPDRGGHLSFEYARF